MKGKKYQPERKQRDLYVERPLLTFALEAASAAILFLTPLYALHQSLEKNPVQRANESNLAPIVQSAR